MRESEFIERLRRIAIAPEARGLLDDVAVLDGFVITHDAIAEGVHFLSTDPPASVGWKLVAVNLSDLAAKGASPAGALLSMTLAGDSEWEDLFLDGVGAACESYGLPLIGGDTIALPEASMRLFGMTAIGRAGTSTPGRDGGRPGDGLWLVGTIGDAAAGLAMLQRDRHSAGPLVEVYRRPVPQLAAGGLLAPHATAAMDVSDGLLLDALRMARASGCMAAIVLDSVPLSEPFRHDRGDRLEARLFAVTGGDDYALLAALPPDFDPETLSLPRGTTMQRIGQLEAGTPGLRLTSGGRPVDLPERLGYEHRGHPASPVAYRP